MVDELLRKGSMQIRRQRAQTARELSSSPLVGESCAEGAGRGGAVGRRAAQGKTFNEPCKGENLPIAHTVSRTRRRLLENTPCTIGKELPGLRADAAAFAGIPRRVDRCLQGRPVHPPSVSQGLDARVSGVTLGEPGGRAVRANLCRPLRFARRQSIRTAVGLWRAPPKGRIGAVKIRCA
jgi:hypothetical protein